MILVTIGTQLPFDRLIQAVDRLAGELGIKGFAQIGPGEYQPRHMESVSFISPEKFSELVGTAECIISHAGMGTIISALQYGCPAIIMARRAELGEHRNNHQISTVERFKNFPGINVVNDYDELKLAYLGVAKGSKGSVGKAPLYADKEFIKTLRELIFN